VMMDESKPRFSKRLRAGTRRRYHDDGVSDEETDGRRTFDLDEPLSSERFGSARIVRMAGTDFTYEYVQRGGLRDPVLFQRPDGLGLQMPEPDFSVNDVKMFVGSRRMMDVMDVSTQKATEMSMAQWTRYYETPPSQRDKLYNATSLEFSHTKLDRLVRRPATLDLLDWVDTMWPRHLKERQRDSSSSVPDMQYPKVQKYCLMSVEGCYTDFHVDFGGTSVWYHVLRGSKVFWLIPPTPQNLQLYEDWVLSGKQGDVFLGDRASDCQRMELQRGCTFIIPSGWIHAVYTPVDSLVFGGNFLHSFNVPTQLDICSIEDRTRVPGKFRFPFYYEMCWYVLDRYVFSLTGTSYLTPEFQKLSLGIGESRRVDIHTVLRVHRESSESTQSPQRVLRRVLRVLRVHTVHRESTQSSKSSDSTESPQRDSDDDPPAGQIHLTPLELDGLWNLLGKLEVLPSNRKCVPAGIHNAAALVSHVKALLKEHANDVPKLSYTGKPVVRWPRRVSRALPVRPFKIKDGRTDGVVASCSRRGTGLLLRPLHLPRCEACVRPECGECNFCRDMKKFGGPGKLKQTCVLRQCLSPGLPLSAVCEICKEPNQEETGDPSLTLMECSNCAQIVHPACLTVPGDGVVNQDLPSCWECPKCVQGITDPEEEPAERRLRPRSARAGFGTPGSASVLKLKRGAGPRDGVRRGRGVRLRGGSRMQRRGDDSEDSDEDDEDDEDEDEEEEEDEEDEEEDSEDGEKERQDVGNERGGEKEVWVSVFKFLNRNELLVCMTVCKAWYKWSCDKRLWSHVDVSRGGPLRNQALAGIVKRQPVSLDLSWTPVAKRQLNCLLTRLPGLRELRVSGLSWFCLSSMVSPSLPHLRLLDLRWCEGVGDAQIRDMVCPPGGVRGCRSTPVTQEPPDEGQGQERHPPRTRADSDHSQRATDPRSTHPSCIRGSEGEDRQGAAEGPRPRAHRPQAHRGPPPTGHRTLSSHTYLQSPTHIHPHIQTYIHTYRYTHIHTHIHTYTYTLTHIYIHIQIHTHIHIHTYPLIQ
uniref:[histone H3]-dimethyl-L-lysine(36) demethylase n=1 Tax=Salarias fasciatus TaxID=181472 RepID=A0A672I9Z6_SALFA